jgi:hypothetical protein
MAVARYFRPIAGSRSHREPFKRVDDPAFTVTIASLIDVASMAIERISFVDSKAKTLAGC